MTPPSVYFTFQPQAFRSPANTLVNHILSSRRSGRQADSRRMISLIPSPSKRIKAGRFCLLLQSNYQLETVRQTPRLLFKLPFHLPRARRNSGNGINRKENERTKLHVKEAFYYSLRLTWVWLRGIKHISSKSDSGEQEEEIKGCFSISLRSAGFPRPNTYEKTYQRLKPTRFSRLQKNFVITEP